MKKYYLPAKWEVEATIIVEAESLKEAIAQAHISPLPRSPKYVTGSFNVDESEATSFTAIMNGIKTPLLETV